MNAPGTQFCGSKTTRGSLLESFMFIITKLEIHVLILPDSGLGTMTPRSTTSAPSGSSVTSSTSSTCCTFSACIKKGLGLFDLITFDRPLPWQSHRIVMLFSLMVNYINSEFPDSKVHGANLGPTSGRQNPGGPYVGHMNLAIWVGQLGGYTSASKTIKFG